MRIGRIILASLAPLIGFSALMTPAAASEPAQEDVIIRLWHTVVQLVAAPVAESASTISLPDYGTLHAFLPVTALSSTPFRHSLWMVTALGALLPFPRRPRQVLLRC